MSDKISVLIPCFNGGQFIREAVESALSQDYSEKEVIVIDDGSTDNSLEVLGAFSDQIKTFSRPNKGGNYTRNELLEKATGAWIQYLDADDYLAPGKLSEQMHWISSNPDFDIVYGPVMVVYDDGKSRRFDKQDVVFPNDPWAALVSWELPQTGSPLFRRDALLKVNGWNAEQKVCQEHELYLRLLKSGARFVGVPDFKDLVHYRHWSESTVSKRNVYNTILSRIDIMENAYKFMVEHGLANEFRNRVFLEWCLLMARSFWTYDKKKSRDFFLKYKEIYPLEKIHSKFLSPGFIQLVHWLGFGITERLASLMR